MPPVLMDEQTKAQGEDVQCSGSHRAAARELQAGTLKQAQALSAPPGGANRRRASPGGARGPEQQERAGRGRTHTWEAIPNPQLSHPL